MVPKLQRHTKRLVTSFLLCTAMFFSQALPARAQQAGAQQSEDLEQQLQQLKQQYDETTQSLQQRIAALEQLIQHEQQIQKQKEEQTKEGTVSAQWSWPPRRQPKMPFSDSQITSAQSFKASFLRSRRMTF
jgi:TolA-binding protein